MPSGSDASPAEQTPPHAAAARAACAFAALALGMMIARAEPRVPALVWWAVASAGACAALVLRSMGVRAALLAACAATGAAVFSVRITEGPDDTLAAIVNATDDERPLTVEGIALESARPPLLDGAMSPFGRAPAQGSFMLRAERVLTDQGWTPCSSAIRCRVPATTYSSAAGLGGFGVRAGQRVRLTGVARRAPEFDNPGQPDLRQYAAQRSAAGELRVESPSLVAVLDDPAHSPGALLARARDALHERAILALDPGPGAGPAARALVLSLFLGQSEPGERELRAAFTRLGLAHVLAISGVHVVVMAGVARLLIRLTGERGSLESLAVAALVVVYLLAVPASAPVVRAGLMTLALLAGAALGRRYDPLALIAWCACAIILWRPLDLWSLGFQLSFGLTAALLWLGTRAHERLFGPRIRGLAPVRRGPWTLGVRWARDRFTLALSASLLCWSAGAPAIAARTGLVSPMAVLTSLVVAIPIAALMWAGYVALIIGLAWPDAASALHPVIGAIARACAAIIDRLDHLPLTAIRVPPLSPWWAAAATALVLAWFALERRFRRPLHACALGLVLWSGAAWWAAARPHPERLRLDALALGEGSCTLVRSGRDALLWNAGSSRLDAGQRLIPSALRALGAWRVPTIVLASPELRCLSAVPDLVEPLGVRTVLLCRSVTEEARGHPESGAAWLVAHLRSRSVEVRSLEDGDSVPVGDCSLTALAAHPREASPRPMPGCALVRDADGALVALLADDLATDDLSERALGGVPRLVVAGRSAKPARWPGSIVLALREESPSDDAQTLAVSRRSAWASVGRDGTARAGRHGP